MKIVIIGPAHPFRGGIANTNEALCRSLNKEGNDCSIVTFKMQYPSLLFPGKTQYSEDPAPTDIQIIEKVNSVNPLSWFTTANTINKIGPDLIIVRYWLPFMAPCLGTISRLCKTPLKLALCDNVIPHESRIGDRQLTSYFIHSFNKYVTLSNTVKDEINEFTTKEVSYLPHPINDGFGDLVSKTVAKKHLGLDNELNYILFFGLVRKYKGLDLMLKSLTFLPLKELKVHLLIVGEFYDNPEEYKQFIQENNLSNFVTIINEFVPSSEVKHYFCSAEIMAQTYHTASQSGVSQIAYHFNCPMLVTDVGGLSEIVPHQKVGYVTPKEPEMIANELLDFFQNNRFEEFSKNVNEEKKRFSWEEFSKNMVQYAIN